MNYFSHKNVTLKTNDIRRVMVVPSRPQGGAPYHDSGKVLFDDGEEMTVSLDLAEALKLHLDEISD